MFAFNRYYHYYTAMHELFNPTGLDGFRFIKRINHLFNGDEEGLGMECVLMIYYLQIDIRKAYDREYKRQQREARKERFWNALSNALSHASLYA